MDTELLEAVGLMLTAVVVYGTAAWFVRRLRPAGKSQRKTMVVTPRADEFSMLASRSLSHVASGDDSFAETRSGAVTLTR